MPATNAPTDSFTLSLAHAVITSSDTPLLMLGANLAILAASTSFCRSFALDHGRVVGTTLTDIGAGEWNVPQLAALLLATASGDVAVDGYEMDLTRAGKPTRCLSVNAHKLDFAADSRVMVLLSITDISEARSQARQKDRLVQEKAVLIEELQHRVANSLQVIASVLLQSARRVQSDETRTHLYDAHHRVMSVAALQHQLAISQSADVELLLYLTNLCRSIGASMIRDRDIMTIKVEVDDSVVKPDVSLSLGLVVTELVINCLKHAFPGQRGGRITVSFTSGDGEWCLGVQDDGVGMPVVAGDSPAGLGSNIVKALAAQLEADIQVTDTAPGTRITLRHSASIASIAIKPAAVPLGAV